MTLTNNEYAIIEHRIPNNIPLEQLNNYCIMSGGWLVWKKIGNKRIAYMRMLEIETTAEYEGDY